MSHELPYEVEYSKSGRAACKICKNPIAKDVLRMATIVQSPFHDGKIPKWHHASCFFKKFRPQNTGDIAHFDNIRWEDQEFIKKHLGGGAGSTPEASTSKGRKRSNKEANSNNSNKDFKMEYAKSNRSKCCGCEETILKDEVRISKMDYEGEKALRFGGLPRWYHPDCFVKLRADLSFFDSGTNIPGFKILNKEDKEKIKSSLPKMKEADHPPPAKKVKVEAEDAQEEKQLKLQTQKFFKIRDKLKDLVRAEMVELLEYNGQTAPSVDNEKLDALTDCMLFGALEPCPKCNGQFEYKSGTGYKCTGSVTEWALCENTTQDPKRKVFKVPKDLKENNSFLASYKCKVKRRLIKITASSYSNNVKKEDETDGPKVVRAGPKPLKHLDFVIAGHTKKSKDELMKEIVLLGGTVRSKVRQDTAAVIATPDAVEKMLVTVQEAKDNDIHVVSEDFVEEAKDFQDAPIILIKNKSIAPWGGDPSTRVSKSIAVKSASRGKSSYEKAKSGTAKLKIKGGGVVDPASGLEDIAHVYQRGKDKFTVTLGLTDIQLKKNSFYKLQILKHDKQEKYWLFRSWGRIGTTIGGEKKENMSLEECVEMFEALYEEKTGNKWRNRNNFVKKPQLMYPIDIDHGEDDNAKVLESNVESKLKKEVQDLIRLIFDVESMKKAMLEYEIDMDKMPLGKLSKKQIQQAFSVLNELSSLIKEGCTDNSKLITATNKFYTLIPHDFGVNGPSVMDSQSMIQAKTEMLESLLEMEIAYSILHSKSDSSKNPLDSHYEKLKTNIDVLNRESEEFKLIEKYIKNTHAETHSHYKLVVDEVYVANRNGEDKRYKPFKKLPNRKLLWHGSRTTNFAGILSQGLRIAPPEAPSTGYMFGKGIYFADMVSKSANYCCTNSQNPTGLLLLCDVALGNMYERYDADYIEKLPHGMHSCWGRGQTQPDPEKSVKLKNGVEVPCGIGIPAEIPKKSSLLYNEFIVYDVAQVKVEYLVKLKFDYKY